MQLLKEFQDKFVVNGSRSLKMELVEAGNYVGITANNCCLIVVMSDQKLKEISDTIIQWLKFKGSVA